VEVFKSSISERLTMEHIVCGSSQRPDAVLPAMEGTRHEEEMTVAQFMEDIVLSSRPWIKQPDNKGSLASKLSTLGAHIPLSLCLPFFTRSLHGIEHVISPRLLSCASPLVCSTPFLPHSASDRI